MKRVRFFVYNFLRMYLFLALCQVEAVALTPALVKSSSLQEDAEYEEIESAWRVGQFWKAKRALKTLIDLKVHEDPLQSALFLPQCFYLQAEMELMQNALYRAHQSYKKARCFSHSSQAPWYTETLAKSIYCLVMTQEGLSSVATRLSEAELLWRQYLPSLSSALESLQCRPFSLKCAQQWMHTYGKALEISYALPESYSLQKQQWMHAQSVMRKKGRFSHSAQAHCLHMIYCLGDGLYTADALHHLILAALQVKDHKRALRWWNLLYKRCEDSPYCAESLFLIAQSAEEQGDLTAAYAAYKQGASSFSESSFAAESAFLSYPYSDYLEEKEPALKNLGWIQEQFPHSPYALFSLYIQALKHCYVCGSKKEKDLLSAIYLLEELQERADEMQRQGDIPPNQQKKVKSLVDCALYEQAEHYQRIAQEAVGAKKQLFIAYSQASYQKLLERCSKQNSKQTELNFDQDGAFLNSSHCYYGLAKCAQLLDEPKQTKQLVHQLLNQMDSQENLLLTARAYFLLGECSEQLGEEEAAEQFLIEAERLASKGCLPAEERIALYTLQSRLYRRIGKLPEALYALSQIVNDPSRCKARFEAIYGRAEIYCAQGRSDLAKRQWEVLLETQGIWADKARKQLEEYHVR